MKFLVDECLPHMLVRDLAAHGFPDSVHPIHIGLLGVRDETILKRAIAEDRIIISANAKDFRRLLAATPIHPGAFTIAQMDRPHAWRLVRLALGFLELQLDPASYMINRVIEVSASCGIRPYALPPDDPD